MGHLYLDSWAVQMPHRGVEVDIFSFSFDFFFFLFIKKKKNLEGV